MAKVDDFISRYRLEAELASVRTGIPSSLILAQAALESDWGLSGLASKFLNFFGIKDHGQWSGKSVWLDTTEERNGVKVTEKAEFRVYDTASESFGDWVDFLRRNSRYEEAGVFAGGSAYDVADSLAKAGYATDSNYAPLLKRIIGQIETNPNYLVGYSTEAPTTEVPSGYDGDSLTFWDWVNPAKHWESFNKAVRFPWTEEGRDYLVENGVKENVPASGFVLGAVDTIKGEPLRTVETLVSVKGEQYIVVGIILVIVVIIGVMIYVMLKSGGGVEA